MNYRTLVDVQTLAAQVGQPGWVMVDCRFTLGDPEAGRQLFAKGTIPGAVYAHLDEDLSGPILPGKTGRHPLPEPEQLAERLGAWGIGDGVQVVAFDDRGGSFAARLWWMLRWLGHEQAAVLDGGIGAWTAAGQALGPGQPQTGRAPQSFVPRVDPSLAVDAEQVVAALSEPKVAVLDARRTPRFRGEQEPVDPKAGHIAGAQSAPCVENLGPDGRFLDPTQLRARFEALLGPRSAGEAICYCGSGVTACHDILAMVHAGMDAPRLYPGSWSEWILDPSRPTSTGDP